MRLKSLAICETSWPIPPPADYGDAFPMRISDFSTIRRAIALGSVRQASIRSTFWEFYKPAIHARGHTPPGMRSSRQEAQDKGFPARSRKKSRCRKTYKISGYLVACFETALVAFDPSAAT